MMDSRTIALRLIDLAAEAEPIEVEVEGFPLTENEEPIIAQESGMRRRYLAPAEQMLDELQEALSGADWAPEVPDVPMSERDHWTFGTAMIIKGVPRAIHGGFLQPLRLIPILTRVPERVALYLITIDEGEYYLDKEHGVVGWHYHYLDWRKHRSDVVLCWDTRWNAPNPPPKPPARRGLFVEKHAEKGKPFEAKPWKWGPRKRETMYDVCSADLRNRQIEEYRCAANKSEPVYPPGATLTPHPSSTVVAPVKASGTSGRKGKKRRR
jgi:hypothetical protein